MWLLLQFVWPTSVSFPPVSVFFSLKPQSLSIICLLVLELVICQRGIEKIVQRGEQGYKYSTHILPKKSTFSPSAATWMLSCVSNLEHLAQSCKICPRWQKQVVCNLIPPTHPGYQRCSSPLRLRMHVECVVATVLNLRLNIWETAQMSWLYIEGGLSGYKWKMASENRRALSKFD